MPAAESKRSPRIAAIVAALVLLLILALVFALKLVNQQEPREALVNDYGAQIEEYDGHLEVNLSSPGIKDLAEIAALLKQLDRVSSLVVSQCPSLESLQGLELLTEIEDFSVIDCARLSSVDDISWLKQLRTLTISECFQLDGEITIPAAPSLEGVYIENCPKLDRVTFAETPALKQLFLGGDIQLSAIGGLENLRELTDLDISTCHQLKQLDGIESLDKLLMFDLRNCVSLASLDFLEKLSSL